MDPVTRRYRMTISYDGTAFNGWQRQPLPARTVQRDIEAAAGSVVSHPVIVDGSSRTDQGVHAQGQVGIFASNTHLEPEVLRRAINSRLAPDVLIHEMSIATDDFNVFRPKSKRYRYLIWAERERPMFNRNFVYHYYQSLDVPAMQTACAQFVGEHDFASFRGTADERDNTVRTIFHCDIHRRGSLVVFSVEGSGFLYHMVRTMVGTVLEVGRGHWKPECISRIIAATDRRSAGPTAPAQGLCLQWIRY